VAWTEDRWHVTVKNDDDSVTRIRSARYGKGKRWRVRFEDAEGAERGRSFERKEDAEQFRVKVGADLLAGTYLDPAAGKITLRKFAAQWLANQAIDDSTRESLAGRIKLINNGLGGRTLAQLASSPSAVQAWVSGLNRAPSTTRHTLQTLSVICEAAVYDGRMVRNPCKVRSVKAPQVPRRKVRPLEAEETAALRAALPPHWQAMANAAASCGLRQGEIFALSPGDIDFLRRTIHVCRQVKLIGGRPVFSLPKRGKVRDVPLPDGASVVFSEHIRKFPPVTVTLPWHAPGTREHGKPRPAALMFTTPRSRRAIDRQSFNTYTWRPALRKAGLPVTRENGMHVLRHTYASVMLHNGVSIRRLAEYLGHEDPGFTLRIYTHLMEDRDDADRKAADLAFTVPSPAQKASGTR
jgi:integrase